MWKIAFAKTSASDDHLALPDARARPEQSPSSKRTAHRPTLQPVPEPERRCATLRRPNYEVNSHF